jgi:hypothetical protein
MKTVTRLKAAPFVVLAVLAVLAVLILRDVHRKGLTTREAEDEVVGTAVKTEDLVVRDRYAAVAILGLIALFAFVMWAALRANPGEDEATPPAGGSSASDRTAFR